MKRFQYRHGLDPDGVIGGATVEAMNVPIEERIIAIRTNLDRWRWLPRDLGNRFILVNVAGQELEVVDNDTVVMAMNVVVGKVGNETPIFKDTLEHIEWDEFFEKFDKNNLALVVQDQTARGEKSNFNKIVSRESLDDYDRRDDHDRR